MAFDKSKEQLISEFKFTIDCVRECGKDAAMSESLRQFSMQLSYLDAALTGGKISSRQAAKQAKDLYKAWKATNKGIDAEWATSLSVVCRGCLIPPLCAAQV